MMRGAVTVGRFPRAVPASETALEAAANALSSGQSASFTGPPTAISSFGISWQNKTAYWDRYRNEFHFMAKSQNGGPAKHFIYAESSHSWRATTLDLVPDELAQTGHIWNVTFDHLRGDYYYLDFPQTEYVRYMDRLIEDGDGTTNNPWQTTSAPSTFTLRSQNGEAGVAFHPNLFGQGDPGLIVWCGTRLAAWRRADNSWTLMDSYGGSASDYWAVQNCTSVYIPGLDKLVFGTGKRSSDFRTKFMVVSAGSGGALATNQPPMVDAAQLTPDSTHPPPVVSRTSAGLPWGKMVLDPADDSRVLILEAGPKQSGLRVWSSDDAASTWSLEAYTHPFHDLPWTGDDAGAWTLGCCDTYGVLWGMAYDGSTSQSILWSPG